MLRVLFVLLVLAEPILAKESDVQPNQQIQHLTSLINGAILAEGVITSKLKIDEMTTDWMIVDSMARERDWISSLDSNPQFAEIQELLGQLGPFLDVIKNGFKKEVPMDQLEKIAKLTQAIQSVPTLDFQKMLDAFKNISGTVTFSIDQYSQPIKFMAFLPRAVPFLKQASSNKELANILQSGVDFINAFKTIDVDKLNQSLHLCPKYDGSPVSFRPCEDFYNEVRKVSSVPNVSDIELASYFIRAYYHAGSTLLKIMLDQKHEIAAQREKLQELLPVLASFSKVPNEKIVAEIFKNAEKLKKDDAKLKSLSDALEEFKTISEVISKIANHQSADNQQEAKSSNRFNSYRGFPNGTGSLQDLLTALGSESKIPGRYRNAKLPERVDSMKTWMEKMNHVMNNARGLVGLYEISSNAAGVQNLVGKAEPQGPQTGNNNLFDILRSLSTQKVAEAINTLTYVGEQIEEFQKSSWAFALYESMTSIAPLADLHVWDQLFWSMPTTFDFFVQAKEDFREIEEGNMNIAKLDSAAESKLHQTIMRHTNKYAESIPLLEKYSSAIQKSKKALLVTNIDSMKEKLSSLNSVDDANLNSVKKLSMDELQVGLDSYEEMRTKTGSVTKQNTVHLEKFFKDLTDVEAMKKSILPLPASFNLNTTKSLLATLAASSIGEIPGISGEANGILSNLMAGNPFGSEVLQDLSTGVSAFNKLVGGIDVSKLAKELSLVKADGEANGAIGKLVEGAEYVQIPADPSNVYSLFADDVKLPEHIKKLSDWISRILEAEHQTEKAYLEQNKEKFGALHALVHRVEKHMDADFKLLSDRIEFIFRVLQDDGKLGSGSIIIIVIVVLLLIGLSVGGGFFGYKRWAKIKAKGATSKESASSKKDKLKKERKDEKKGKSVANGSKEVV